MQEREGAKLHIAILMHNLEPGGSQKWAAWLANRFLELGHRVDLLLVSDKAALRPTVDRGVNIRALSKRVGTPLGPRSLLTILALARYLRSWRPDVLLSGVNFTHATALRARRLSMLPIPVVLCLCSKPRLRANSSLPSSIAKKIWGWDEELYGRAEGLIAVSNATARDFRRIRAIGSRPIDVIYNGTVAPHLLARPLRQRAVLPN